MSRNRLLILAIALVTIVVQLVIPISMANRYENILQTGDSYRFKVIPRDPADPFKGRYVTLNFPIESGKSNNLENPNVIKQLDKKAKAYAIISQVDNEVKLLDIQQENPKHQRYIAIKNRYSYKETYRIKLPFDRYYAEESKAPRIEALLWNRERDADREFYADVRIKDGYGVIAELYVDDTPILEYLEKHSSQ